MIKPHFKILGNSALEAKYHGMGYALGAAVDGQLVDFAYLRDTFDLDDLESEDDMRKLLNSPEIGPVVRHMQSLGAVYVGMCSCYEFVIL